MTERYPYISITVDEETKNLFFQYIDKSSDDELNMICETIINECPDKTFRFSKTEVNHNLNFLHKCIYYSDNPLLPKMIEFLSVYMNRYINNKTILDIPTYNGSTCLHLACMNGDPVIREKLVKLLLDLGASVNKLCAYDYNELFLACLYTLRSKHCNIENGLSPYTRKTIQHLVNAGVNVNQETWFATTPLLILLASDVDVQDLCQYLIDSGAKVNKYLKKTIKSRYPNLLQSKVTQLATLIKKSKIVISECCVCMDKTNTIVCPYEHSTCVLCMAKMKKFNCVICNNL